MRMEELYHIGMLEKDIWLQLKRCAMVCHYFNGGVCGCRPRIVWFGFCRQEPGTGIVFHGSHLLLRFDDETSTFVNIVYQSQFPIMLLYIVEIISS